VTIEIYTPDRFEALREAALQLGPDSTLGHRPFVDYYYTGNPWSRLFLAVEDGRVLATLGVETLRFEWEGREERIGIGNNFFSLRRGRGGLLFRRWMGVCPLSLVHGGTADTHRITAKHGWTFYPGVRPYYLNPDYPPEAGQSLWRAAAKAVLRRLPRRPLAGLAARVPAEAARRLSVREEPAFTDDLLPASTPFAFRLAPCGDYLRWRYNTRLPFVRYRLFRLRDGEATAGYVILNDSPRRILVAHCDGTGAADLAWGVVLSLSAAARDGRDARPVTLTSCHPVMQAVFRRAGFRPARGDRPFTIGSLRQGAPFPMDTSAWLVSFDWGDNGLRRPFPDEPPTCMKT